MSSLQLNISTPRQPIPQGMGFYQLEDESLYVQLGGIFESRRFFSYIDSPISRFDLDIEGRLVFFELTVPKRQWKIIENLVTPQIVEPADIRWLSFRKIIELPEILTDQCRTRLYLKLSDEKPALNYYLADKIILQSSAEWLACGILVTGIVDDTGGRKFAEFRRLQSGKPEVKSHFAGVADISPSVS